MWNIRLKPTPSLLKIKSYKNFYKFCIIPILRKQKVTQTNFTCIAALETSVSKRAKELFNSSPLPVTHKEKLMDRLNVPVKPLKSQAKAVTPQQWKFIQELVSEDGRVTLKEAAIRAGYSEKNASWDASRLTNPKHFPQVVAAIQEYRQQLAQKYGTNFERHMRDLQNIRDAALEAGNYGAAVSAEYRRGQALGTIYIDRKEIRVGTIDSMSKEEVQRKLEEIKATYGTPPQELIDITPEEIEEPPETILEAMRNGERSRRAPVQKGEGTSSECGDNENREPSELGVSGLPDSLTEERIRDDGAEGSDIGEAGEDKPTSDSVCVEALEDGDADVSVSGVAPESDQEDI
tara:strand:+ start:164 stop:1207 length:1044 start_codon:yes stop_codon:yes gene_type:complete